MSHERYTHTHHRETFSVVAIVARLSSVSELPSLTYFIILLINFSILQNSCTHTYLLTFFLCHNHSYINFLGGISLLRALQLFQSTGKNKLYPCWCWAALSSQTEIHWNKFRMRYGQRDKEDLWWLVQLRLHAYTKWNDFRFSTLSQFIFGFECRYFDFSFNSFCVLTPRWWWQCFIYKSSVATFSLCVLFSGFRGICTINFTNSLFQFDENHIISRASAVIEDVSKSKVKCRAKYFRNWIKKLNMLTQSSILIQPQKTSTLELV